MLLGVTGCGSDRIRTYPVHGRVEFADGEPVRQGTIELESIETGTTATGTIQPDGSFVLGTFASDDGAAAGEHRAIVVQLIVADGTIRHTLDHGRAVPPEYGNYKESRLAVTVVPKTKNEIVVTLD